MEYQLKHDREVSRSQVQAVLILFAGFALVIFLLLAMRGYVRSEPWMETAQLPLNQKVIAIVELDNGGQAWVLAPKECIDSGLHLFPRCLDRVISLPILP